MEEVDASEIPTLISAANTINNNLGKILNYFHKGSTNASAASFNSKLKEFRSMVRDIRDIKFFLFSISTFYARLLLQSNYRMIPFEVSFWIG